MELEGIDPSTSRLQSARSTIWATTPKLRQTGFEPVTNRLLFLLNKMNYLNTTTVDRSTPELLTVKSNLLKKLLNLNKKKFLLN